MRVDIQREMQRIHANMKTPRAAAPHTFVPAQITLPDLTKRCLICGGPKPEKGAKCPGLAAVAKAAARAEAWELPIPHWTEEEVELAASLPQVFKSPGGKHLIAKKLAGLLPPHATYVEPFAGSAAVFFAKERAPQEVLSDTREGLIDTFRWIRDAKDFTPLFKMSWRPSRKRWAFLRHWRPKTLLGKTYRFLWLSRCSLLNREGEGYSPVFAKRCLVPPMKSRFPKWQERLTGVTLLNRDAVSVIPEYDSPHTSFYLDPPYPKGRHANLYPGREWDEDDLSRLFALCNKLRGKFIMSLNFASLPEKIPARFSVQRVKIPYPALPTSVKTLHLGREYHLRYEVLVKNF